MVEGLDNNLLELIAADPDFNLSLEDLKSRMDPKLYVGRSEQQTEEFVRDFIKPIIDANQSVIGVKAELNV